MGLGLTQLQLVNGRPSNSCLLTEHIVLVTPEGNKTCWKCPHCPVGLGLEPPCGSEVSNTTEIECKQCLANVTYSENHDISSCRPCHDCGLKNVVQQCTEEKNRKCGTVCPEGYYYRQRTDECKLCFHCCSTATDDERVDECIKIGMPRNKQCQDTEKNKVCKDQLADKITKQPTTQRVTKSSSTTFSHTTPTKKLSTLQEHSDKPTLHTTLGNGVINKSSYHDFDRTSSGQGQSIAVIIVVTAVCIFSLFFLVVIAYKKRKRRSSDINQNYNRGESINIHIYIHL